MYCPQILSALAAILVTRSPGTSIAAVAPEDCGSAVISYINTNIAQANSTAQLVSVAEKNGVYAVEARYQGRNISIYATRDCTYLFTRSYNMMVTPTPTTPPTPTPPTEPG